MLRGDFDPLSLAKMQTQSSKDFYTTICIFLGNNTVLIEKI